MSQNGKKWYQIYYWQVSCQHNGNYKIISNKIFYVSIKLSMIDNFVISQFIGQFRGLFKETNGKYWGLCVEKRERKGKNG